MTQVYGLILLQVCIDKLHDIQLALVISRLFDSEEMMTSEVRKILYTHIFGCDENGKNYSELKVNADPFLRSMGYWLIKDYRFVLVDLVSSFSSPTPDRQQSKTLLTIGEGG